MKKLLAILIFCFLANISEAKQILPESFVDNTVVVEAKKTGEHNKKYFYCKENRKCSTEDIVKEYYENNGYKIMRGEFKR